MCQTHSLKFLASPVVNGIAHGTKLKRLQRRLSSRALSDSKCIFNTCGLGGSDDQMWGFLMHAGAIDEARTTQRGARHACKTLRETNTPTKASLWTADSPCRFAGLHIICSGRFLSRPSVRRRSVPMDASDFGKVSQAAPSPVGTPAYIGWSVASRWISPPLALHHTDQVREDLYRISALGRISVPGGIVGF
jgi:hypothetical protein